MVFRSMYEIIRDITLEWASEAKFDDFQRFVYRFVRGFLQINGEDFDTQRNKHTHERDDAFKRQVDQKAHFLHSQFVVQHLSNDKNVDWFIGKIGKSDVDTRVVATVATSVVATVAKTLIKRIIHSAVIYTNMEEDSKPAETDRAKSYYSNLSDIQYYDLQKNLLSFFYPSESLRVHQLPSQPRKILNEITQKVLDKTRDFELYKLYYKDEPKQQDLMEKILQDITVQWAEQVDFKDFETFVLRFVRGFLQIKKQIFDREYAEAFATPPTFFLLGGGGMDRIKI
jgi:hypothetical protein